MILSPRARTRRPAAAAVLLGGAVLLAGCGSGVSATTTEPDAGRTVTVENCGRDVVVDGVPKAAVGMHPAQTEMLVRLGVVDRLVGQAQAAAQPLPEDVAELVEDVPVLGGDTPPSREDLLAVQPDFVYAPTTYEFSAEQGFASIEQLEDAGAQVYVATGGCADRRMTAEVADLFTDLENLGRIFAVESAAADLVAEGRAELAAVEEAVSGVDRLRVAQVYVEGPYLSAIGAGVEYDMLRLAGADNVYTPDQPAFADFFAATITPESLAAEEPEALVFAVSDDAHEQAVREFLTTTFPDMPAVRDGRLVAISSADVFPGTLGNVSVVRQIAEELYPDAF